MVTHYVVNYHEHDSEKRYARSTDKVCLVAGKKYALTKAIAAIVALGGGAVYEKVDDKVGPQFGKDWKSKVRAQLADKGRIEFFFGCSTCELRVYPYEPPVNNGAIATLGDFGHVYDN